MRKLVSIYEKVMAVDTDFPHLAEIAKSFHVLETLTEQTTQMVHDNPVLLAPTQSIFQKIDEKRKSLSKIKNNYQIKKVPYGWNSIWGAPLMFCGIPIGLAVSILCFCYESHPWISSIIASLILIIGCGKLLTMAYKHHKQNQSCRVE